MTGNMGNFGEFFFDNCTFFFSLIVPTTPTTIGAYNPYHACGSWAGDRILCLGDYAEDLPEGLLTNSQKTVPTKILRIGFLKPALGPT